MNRKLFMGSFHYQEGGVEKWGYTSFEGEPVKGFSSEQDAFEAFQLHAQEYDTKKLFRLTNKRRKVFVDFDGTIYRGPLVPLEEMPPPEDIVVQTMRDLIEEFEEVVIYSCRSSLVANGSKERSALLTKWMTDYLEMYEIPYTRLEYDKPLYDVLIDDRALSGIEWSDVRKKLLLPPVKSKDPSGNLSGHVSIKHNWVHQNTGSNNDH